jgi:Pyridoxamine 5'-phosphate oxidase
MGTSWPEELDPIIDGDHVVMLAYVTPAKGVVLLPVNNFGIHDRDAGTVTVNSSVGAWRKLERMKSNPRVALAFHTRNHASHDRPEYLLLQGTAKLSEPISDYPSTILDNWERFEPWQDRNRFWRWWQRVYGIRVAIEIDAERITAWPDLRCAGEPTAIGAPQPADPPSQNPPRNGTEPRIDHRRAARKAAALPDSLLGWVGGDGFPMVVPVAVAGEAPGGIALRPPPGLLPPGGRRAGFTAHWFSRGVIGQNQRKHTGWLEHKDGTLVYAPHTESNYRFPSSRLLYRLVSGAGTRWWIRGARRAGIVSA